MTGWTRDKAFAALHEASLSVVEEKSVEHGTQLHLSGGTKINVYETGKVLVQGKAGPEKVSASKLFAVSPSKSAIAMTLPPPPTGNGSAFAVERFSPATKAEGNKVFVVYGHDTVARDQLELLLLRLGITPVIISNLAPDGKTILESLLANSEVRYAVVLLTPDDEGHRANHPDEKKFRARQNVVLELGMFLMKLGRERVAVLHKGNIELPSDINGLIYVSFNTAVAETKNKLAAAMQKAGFHIDIEKLSAE